MDGGKRLVGCEQISLASNAKANGLNEAILSQVWYIQIVVLNKLILLKDVQKFICLPSKARGGNETILDCLCPYSF